MRAHQNRRDRSLRASFAPPWHRAWKLQDNAFPSATAHPTLSEVDRTERAPTTRLPKAWGILMKVPRVGYADRSGSACTKRFPLLALLSGCRRAVISKLIDLK